MILKSTIYILLFVLYESGLVYSEQVKVGESLFFENKTIEYIPGNSPIILSAPHGGKLKPPVIPNRLFGKLMSDMHTDLLTGEIAKEFYRVTGKHAHVIICHLHRSKVDCNRDEEEGVQNNEESLKTWKAFHHCINRSLETVTLSHGKGLYLDIHAHGRPEPWIMLGYLLKSSQLKLKDDPFEKLVSVSSIENMMHSSKYKFQDVLRGDVSLGYLLQLNGYQAVPSPQYSNAGNKSYISGGYNTRLYGRNADSKISAIQVECPRSVRDTEKNRQTYSRAFVKSLVQYLDWHYKIK